MRQEPGEGPLDTEGRGQWRRERLPRSAGVFKRHGQQVTVTEGLLSLDEPTDTCMDVPQGALILRTNLW